MQKEIPILEQSDEQIMQLARQLRTGYSLKRTMRYFTERNFQVHNESVAEHVFGLIFLAQYFLPLEDTQGLLDVAKVDRILLFHDFGEALHGDVPFHLHTVESVQQEHTDAGQIFGSLPAFMADMGYGSWSEYEENKTPEARFAYALDKLEPMFELLDPVNELSIKRIKVSYAVHVEKKIPPLKDFPVMMRFMEAISADMQKRDLFWKEQ